MRPKKVIMTKIHRVSLGFAKFQNTQLSAFSNSVIVALTGNAAFPDLPVDLADLAGAGDAYSQSLVAMRNGGRMATAAKNTARAQLINLLRDEAHYVQIIAKTDLVTLLSSGFTAISRNSAQSPLAAPFIRQVQRPGSGQLRLVFKPIANARSYQVQLKIGDGPWQDGGIYSQARTLIVSGLIPGTVYQIQIRALGGRTGYSAWSPATSCMAV